ncbi:MAG TPA: RidA family protein [Patescibacteria group bacterium]|nr:RidA family protein [Patescibacteria group bacterium]
MTKTFIKNNGAFPLSKAVLHDEKYTMELSGQIGMNSETGKLAEGIEKQTIQTLENINNILNSVKWNLSNIIKVRIYLSDMENYAKMNEFIVDISKKIILQELLLLLRNYLQKL